MKNRCGALAWLVVMSLFSTARADEDGLAARFQALVGNTDPAQEDWSLHGQLTDVLQGYPSFPAAYSGANSLAANSQVKNTATANLFLGRRLWQGAEVYYDPQLDQGVALSNGLGVAGYPNGEGSKVGSYDFKTTDARLFLRQVIGLGGPTETIAAAANQLAGVEDVSRLTFTVGKFAAPDFFDDNSYSHDPASQFLNWSMMDSAAWDYPSNARGYTQGLVIELNQERWALRYGAMLMSKDANGDTLPTRGLKSLGQVVELEERYTLADNPGKIRFLAFLNRDRQGNFQDAFNLGGNVNTAIAEVEKYGDVKYGFAINAEQRLNGTVGAFARLSWNDGHTEDWEFTQVDESAAMGLSVSGAGWGRSDDVWGIAGAINGLSSDQRKFVEQGGLGIIIGDGRLNYSPEMILETYYAFKLCPYATFSPDYQFIANPGYNTDRGPVSIFAGRLQAEF